MQKNSVNTHGDILARLTVISQYVQKSVKTY